MDQTWLRLTDYASKYRISISTLRRRIKNGQLTYRFEDGKYFVPDEIPNFIEAVCAKSTTFAAQGSPLVTEDHTKQNQLRGPGVQAPAGAEANIESPDEPIL